MKASQLQVGVEYAVKQYKDARTERATLVEVEDLSTAVARTHTIRDLYRAWPEQERFGSWPWATQAARVYAVVIVVGGVAKRQLLNARHFRSTWTDWTAVLARTAALNEQAEQARLDAWAERDALIARLRPVHGDDAVRPLDGRPYLLRQHRQPERRVSLTVDEYVALLDRIPVGEVIA